jgi:hypothetical protein
MFCTASNVQEDVLRTECEVVPTTPQE